MKRFRVNWINATLLCTALVLILALGLPFYGHSLAPPTNMGSMGVIPAGSYQVLKLDTAGMLRTNGEGGKATYGCSVLDFTPAGTAKDILVVTGSATKTVTIRRASVSKIGTAGTVDVSVIKRTVADTLGTSTAPTIGQFDSADTSPTATVKLYTANPVIGTGVSLTDQMMNFGAAGSAGNAAFDFGTRNDESLHLRGVTQQAALSFNGATFTYAGTVSAYIEWTEE